MTRPSLAGIEKRAAAATEGPWEASGSCVGTRWTGASDWSGPIDDRELVATASPADVGFIADARADAPALTAAVRDVLALHRAVEVEPSDTICAGCSTLRGAGSHLRYFPVTEYPCPTVRALAAHLDLTDPEGDQDRDRFWGGAAATLLARFNITPKEDR